MTTAPGTMTPTTTTPTRRSRAWIGYFILLVVLGCTAMLAPVLYNWSLQLRPDQIASARQRWAQTGLREYDLDYRVKRNADPRPDVYHVEVRDGRAVRVICNGEPLLLDDAPTGLAVGVMAGLYRAEDPRRQTVDGIFGHIEGLVTATQGNSSPKRDYCTGRFDPEAGYPIHFVYRTAGTHQRQEWTIRLSRLRRDSE